MRRTFATLDGLRGAAAIAVLVMHAALATTPDRPIFGSPYLSVDLFFLLSGFVIGHAYDDKLAAGMGLRRFCQIRIVRLYPLYLLGLAMAVATPVAIAVSTQEWWTAKLTAVTLPWALFMLPRPVAEPTHWFIINLPRWSLFYELLGNLIYAVLILRLNKRVLIGIVALTGTSLTIISLYYGSINLHPNWWLMAFTCLSRMGFSFTMGLLLYRLWREGALPSPKWPAIFAVMLFLCMITIPSSGPAAGILTAGVVIVGFPLVLIIGVANEPSARMAPAMREGGRISYALYVLHWPIIIALGELARRNGVSNDAAKVAAIPISLTVAWYASRYFDEPVRAWLKRRMARQPHVAADASVPESFGGFRADPWTTTPTPTPRQPSRKQNMSICRSKP